MEAGRDPGWHRQRRRGARPRDEVRTVGEVSEQRPRVHGAATVGDDCTRKLLVAAKDRVWGVEGVELVEKQASARHELLSPHARPPGRVREIGRVTSRAKSGWDRRPGTGSR